jgi:CAAX protease family protein
VIPGPDERAPAEHAPATPDPLPATHFVPEPGLRRIESAAAGGYRAVQVASIGLILAGGAVVAYALSNTVGLLSGEILQPGTTRGAVATLVLLIVGAAALVAGLVINAARSIVVRELLPPERYRGPSIIVLWLIATIAANLAVVPVAGDLTKLLAGGQPTVFGTLVTLTVTQGGLVAAAALLVYAPRALAGLRLVPRTGLARSTAIGIGLAVPAWIIAQLIGYLTIRLLEPFGLRPEAGVADAALSNADPTVLVVALVVVAPIAEELFFRGVVYNAWEREYGPTRALYGSAILFAVIHGSAFVIPSIFVLGLVLGQLFRTTRSLPATILLHAGFNAITVTIALLFRFGVIDIPIT